MLASAITFLLGLFLGLIIRITQYDNNDKQQRRLIRRLTAENSRVKSEIAKERNRRFGAEIYLEEAAGIIGYQRDKLYAINHPAELVEEIQ